MRALVLVAAIAGCAIEAPALPAGHPANPAAPPGRLAGPPADLRPGAVAYPDLPAAPIPMPMPMHHHHGS